ncbi:MAG TPA: RHS repeat-associated core domain-containing protein, partial [Rhodanobacteraceae bacterium]|nr:RHS repeat-associated core domain-containing protein [Rhodanobacteraceae bacterium]
IDNGVVTDFVSLGAVPVARITGGAATYILPDYQNTPLFELDSAGNITRSPDFLSYGRPADAEGQGEIPSYTGAAADPTTGFLYLGARYLHFSRFLSVDPAPLDPTSPTGLNRYAYANDNPARYTDPFGRYACKGRKEDCDAVAKGRASAKTAIRRLPDGPGKRRLQQVLMVLGPPGDTSTDVTVTINSGVTDNKAVAGGTRTDPKTGASTVGIVISAVKNNPAKLGGILVHEGEHVVDQRINGMPRTRNDEMSGERAAYAAQAVYYQGLGKQGPFMIYSPADGNGVNFIGVDAGATISTDIWCGASGAPGC